MPWRLQHAALCRLNLAGRSCNMLRSYRGNGLVIRIFCLAILASVLSAGPASAYYRDYVPQPLLANLRRLPQKQVAEFGLNWTHTFNGVTATNDGGSFSLKGVDSQGRAWEIVDENPREFGGVCFTADVDRNGVEDLIFVFSNASCGLPFQAIDIAFFDGSGRVRYEEAVSRLSWSNEGVDDLLVSADGKNCYLLIQDLAYGKLGNRDLGYWRFSIMQARGLKLVKTSAALGMRFPVYVWYTHKPNHRPSARTELLEAAYRAANTTQ